jgi:NADPH-dependent 2,4-dienoyl-CoA reductase/sulfur reductase-like enzyme
MRLLVIGGIAAGMSAAARARRIDPGLEILVLEKGDAVSYGACGLPYYVEDRVHSAGDLIVYTPEYFRKERNITVRTGAEVVEIAHARREVALSSGERIHYDRLVIATGARPDCGAIAGADQPHVFRLNTLADGIRLKTYLTEKKPRRAVIIGGGFIGLEAVDSLRRNGLSVTLFQGSNYLLRREDADLTKALVVHLQRFGVQMRLGEPVPAIEADRVGDTLCDLVLVATGLRPNAEMAAAAGVERGRTGAIRVDERMQTNLGGVYAAGDCAETMHLVTGRPAYIPLGTTANKQGRVAGANAAGVRERFAGVVGTCVLSMFGLGVGMTGLSAEQARREGFSPVSARIEARSQAKYFGGKSTAVELIADKNTGRLLGGVVTGEHGVAGRINVIASALHNSMTVDEFERLDLAYAPPFSTVWDPLLIAAQQLARQL